MPLPSMTRTATSLATGAAFTPGTLEQLTAPYTPSRFCGTTHDWMTFRVKSPSIRSSHALPAITGPWSLQSNTVGRAGSS